MSLACEVRLKVVGVLARAKKPVNFVSCISTGGIAPYDAIHDVAAAVVVAVGCVAGAFDVGVAVTIVVVIAAAIVSV